MHIHIHTATERETERERAKERERLLYDGPYYRPYIRSRSFGLTRFTVAHISYKPLEPREGEPRQPNKAYRGLSVAFGPYYGLLGRHGLCDHNNSKPALYHPKPLERNPGMSFEGTLTDPGL